ncbi:hypothetical protein FGB62_2g10 [Gracilaria domingensis]|nr:hypothetical protein FGB62_2g10 [Gracilaria domingensis]
MDAGQASMSAQDASLFPFILFVLAFVLWIVVVVLVVPRLLGRAVSFFTNRAFGDDLRLVIHSIYIYPLAGRAVAHSVQYTVPNGTIDVEQLVLQIRWWRKSPVVDFNQLLTVDQPATLDRFAHAQQELQKENTAFFLKRPLYRLRRCWRRAAAAADVNDSTEPSALISIHCIGLRTRMVNYQSNYNLLRRVTELARNASRRASFVNNSVRSRDVCNAASESAGPAMSSPSSVYDKLPSSSRSSFSSVQSVDEKPLIEHLLELTSFRITHGAFYFCDMGESPLVRLSVKSAKLRYMYGAPSCPVDKCRKRIRMRMSGLRLSVADKASVKNVIRVTSEDNSIADSDSEDANYQDESNTNRMIRRVLSRGYRGISEPIFEAQAKNESRSGSTNRRNQRPGLKAHFMHPKTWSLNRKSHRSRSLPCSDVLNAETAIIDYVFDEPGVEHVSRRGTSSRKRSGRTEENFGVRDDSNTNPPPVCRVSIVLRGTSFSYDVQAIADIERVLERLQPPFYDLVPVAKRLFSREGKRAATGIQITVDATPVSADNSSSNGSRPGKPLLSIPFGAQETTWKALELLNIRTWKSPNLSNSTPGSERKKGFPIQSRLLVKASKVSLRTEIPYEYGAPQKTVVTFKDIDALVEGIVNMPIGCSKLVTLTRIVQTPQVWNDEHHVSYDILTSQTEFRFFPDTLRIFTDISTTIREHSKKPESIRYFVPYRERVNIRAEDEYSIFLTCSHDNAWNDVQNGISDQYGVVKMHGTNAELDMKQVATSSFVNDSSELHWSLSLPKVSGKLALDVSQMLTSIQKSEAKPDVADGRNTGVSYFHKSRTPSLAQRMLLQIETFVAHHNSVLPEAISETTRDVIERTFLTAGERCELSGKLVSNDGMLFLEGPKHAFLDSVNWSEMRFSASSIVVDLNPHHTTSFLNVTRNYACGGNHTISSKEQSRIEERRRPTSLRIIGAGRYPNTAECLTMGLGSGLVMSSGGTHNAADDVFEMNLEIDSLLLRIHELPHPLSPFSLAPEHVCSVVSADFGGSLRSNRLGSEMKFFPRARRKQVSIFGGYLPCSSIRTKSENTFINEDHSLPRTVLKGLRLLKRSAASPFWGSYNSELILEIDEVKGCIMDYSLKCLSGFITSAIPHPLYEDQTAIASMLSVDTIQFRVGSSDFFVLSPGSSIAARRSGQRSRNMPNRTEKSPDEHFLQKIVPKFLQAITHVSLSKGLRFVISSLATETLASRSRLLISELSLEIMIPWDDKLPPWVDEATMRAQVSHSSPLGTEPSSSLFKGIGVLRKVGECRRAELDMFMEFKPSIWSSRIAFLQEGHVTALFDKFGRRIPRWTTNNLFLKSDGRIESEPNTPSNQEWWDFISDGKEALIVKTRKKDSDRDVRLETTSVSFPAPIVFKISPSCVEVLNDMVTRMQEGLSRYKYSSENAGDGQSFSSDDGLLALWTSYEQNSRSVIPRHLLLHAPRTNTLKALETVELSVHVLPPIAVESLDADRFSNLRTDAATLILSLPRGLHFLHSALTGFDEGNHDVHDPLSGSASQPPSGFISMKTVFHTSIHSIALQCYRRGQDPAEVGIVKEITFILRDHVIAKDGPLGGNFSNPRQREKNHAVVGKVGSFSLGSGESSLSAYTSFGKSASVFLLLLRTLALNHSSLQQLEAEVLEAISTRYLGTSLASLHQKHHSEVYRLLVRERRMVSGVKNQLFKQIRTGHEENETSKEFVIDSSQYNGTNYVKSMDLAVRNVSVKISKEEMLYVNVFLCKTGSSTKSGDRIPQNRHEIVIKAAFGIVTVFMTDHIAANSLRMVSEVASFVGRATRFFPMLRSDTEQTEDYDAGSLTFVSSPSRADNYDQQSSRRRYPIEYAGLSGNNSGGLESDTFRWSPRSYRRLGHARSVPRFQVTSSGARDLGQAERQPNSVQTSTSASRRLTTSHNRPNGLHNTEADSSVQNLSPSSKNGYNANSFLTSKNDNSLVRGVTRMMRSQEKETGSLIASEESSMYQVVAVTTSRETGPPLKRAKRMIPKTVVPPAFIRPKKSMEESLTRKFSPAMHDQKGFRSPAYPDRKGREQAKQKRNGRRTQSIRSIDDSHTKRVSLISKPKLLISPGSFPNITMFLSFKKVEMQYMRGRYVSIKDRHDASRKTVRDAGVILLVNQPRLTLMSSANGMCSIVLTASSSDLRSSNDPKCTMAGAISRFGVTISIAQDMFPRSPPKLILSARISEFVATLEARDLQSVLKFREEFKEDLKGVLTAFMSTKDSISEMARATRLMSSSLGRRALFSTVAIDLLFEDSKVILKGFHPQDTSMSITYLLDGLFFSAVASEADSAALTLGLRLYGHGLCLAAPAWGSAEVLRFPSLDARGVQWVESIGVPTLLKVTAEPLTNSTSVQGLRHILFTVSGLMAFQNLPATPGDSRLHDSTRLGNPDPDLPYREDPDPVPGTPLTRSFAAWERTKGVRMELSIRPMSLSLVSGPVVALFHLQAVTGTFEWNKLVEKGVQLQTAINIPRISLSFMRMPSADFSVQEIKPEDDRTSLSVALERSRVDVLKSQEDLQHTFIFRVEVHGVSGKLHPWRLLRDAAAWADEQEFVSDLQSMNYNTLSSNRQRLPKPVGTTKQTEHRVILVGFNVQRFKLAVPLLSSEEYSSSRLALSATNLHLFARQRFENPDISVRNVIEVKSNFIGIFWESSSLLSSHHARIVLAINHNSQEGLSLFGPTSVVIVPGTWMIHPRKDFIMAINEAKNVKEYKHFSEKTKEMISRPDASRPGSSVAGDSTSNPTEKQDRLLVESLRFKITRTSGFIEGLGDAEDGLYAKQTGSVATDLVAKLSIPAFSIAIARDVNHDFDLIDVDFSGREGEFPQKCLQRVSNLFTELFGADAGEQELTQDHLYFKESPNRVPGRKVSREVSLLVRFGESLYRAQEEANMSFESKFGFFAGKHSAILLSVATAPVFGEEETHTTVYTGISPDLKLEITPLLEGATPQSLRLSTARMLHGISPCFAPHSLFHVSRVTALMEVKTVLLAERRHRLQLPKISATGAAEASNSILPVFESSERNALVVLGRTKQKGSTRAGEGATQPAIIKSTSIIPDRDVTDNTMSAEPSTGSEIKVEPVIRLQLKFDSTPNAKVSQMDVFVYRLLFGTNRSRTSASVPAPSIGSYAILHQGLVRAKWDFLSCNLSLRENMLYSIRSMEDSPRRNWTCVGNILNHLKFDVLRYDTHTLRLSIDALAMSCYALPYVVVFESTDIRTDVSHTLLQAIARLMSLVKKLKNEVKLLSGRDIAKGSKPVGHKEPTIRDNLISARSDREESLSDAREEGQTEVSANLSSEAFAHVLRMSSETLLLPTGTSVSMKGRSLVLVMRGYQFDERRHNATVSLSGYDLRHRHLVVADESIRTLKEKKLEFNFDIMKLSYKDEERQIISDLCKVPDPALVLRVRDDSQSLEVDLQGNLDIKLGSGFYNWRHFRDLAVLTLYGIDVVPNAQESAGRSDGASPARDDDHWNGRTPQLTVNLNPRIDVIGDFTSDVLHRMKDRLGNGEDIPGYMYHHMVLPLEALAELSFGSPSGLPLVYMKSICVRNVDGFAFNPEREQEVPTPADRNLEVLS